MLAVRAFIKDNKGRILIIKRSPLCKTNPLRWELPGGKVNIGEPLEEALKREVKEETGLNVTPNSVLGVAEQELAIFKAVHIIIECSANGKLRLSGEHIAYAWVKQEDLKYYELTDWFYNFIKSTDSP
ncbi:MAG: NUDIX domain-containing protein [Methanothermobacter sp.]|nr:NUDIX domain-containing protein [Methanothermobacter sp.]